MATSTSYLSFCAKNHPIIRLEASHDPAEVIRQMRAGPLSDIVGQAVKGFGHSADMPYLFLLVETDCVAGLRGLELTNPYASHVFEMS
jgi:hypothetical protein